TITLFYTLSLHDALPISRQIAPNVDLKEVAPMPEPEPEPAASEADAAATDQEVADTGPDSEPDVIVKSPVPSETFTLLGKEVLRSEEHTSELQSRENLVC